MRRSPGVIRRYALDLGSPSGRISGVSKNTPSGVGMGQKPSPIYLRPGQTVRLSVEGLGEQQQRTVADSES